MPDAMGQVLNQNSALGYASGSLDTNASNAIQESNNQIPVNNSIDPYSEDTVALQKQLQKNGYYIGETGVDGRMGPMTRAALEMQNNQNTNRVTTEEGRGGVGFQNGVEVPVYATPKFNNRFS